MITRKSYIEIYDWTIHYTEIEKGDKSKDVVKRIRKLFPKKEKKDEIFDEVKDNIDHNRKDGGLCSHWENERKTSVLLYRMTTKKEKIRVTAHELRHAADQILRVMNINDNEAAAFLQGYIFMKLYKI